ncbi:DUF4925 domain-containing protein [Bacteroides ovatus]|nr:DUF4925 domain-containing protein [Bacteroides ovatus]
MIGKSVDFSTVTGETAIINLYDILPGEKEVKIMSIPPFWRWARIFFFREIVWEMRL